MVPGMGTIQGFCASSQASATCAGVALLCPRSRRADRPAPGSPCALPGRSEEAVAIVVPAEGRVRVDRAGEEALAERTERHQPDAEFFKRRDHLRFGLRHHNEYSLWSAVTGWTA